jgi:hypothetical protein
MLTGPALLIEATTPTGPAQLIEATTPTGPATPIDATTPTGPAQPTGPAALTRPATSTQPSAEPVAAAVVPLPRDGELWAVASTTCRARTHATPAARQPRPSVAGAVAPADVTRSETGPAPMIGTATPFGLPLRLPSSGPLPDAPIVPVNAPGPGGAPSSVTQCGASGGGSGHAHDEPLAVVCQLGAVPVPALRPNPRTADAAGRLLSGNARPGCEPD